MALFDDASLVVTPNGYKEGTLYSIKPTSGLGDMTVVRATTATRVNSAGLVEVVPWNLLQQSSTFNVSPWTFTGGVTFTSGFTDVSGGTNAFRFQATSGSYKYGFQTISSTIGQVYTHSIYAKCSSGTQQFKLTDAQQGGGSLQTVTTEWQRFTFTITASGGNIAIEIGNDGTNALDIYICFSQTNIGSTAKDYFPTTTRLNIPRLDYSNGSCPSLLVEPQRTNLVTYSEQFDNADWTKQSGVSVTANQTISPDGTQNADLVVGGGSSGIFQSGKTVSTTVANTKSVYLKGVSGGEVVRLQDPYQTLGYTVCTLTTSWQRFTLSEVQSGGFAGLWVTLIPSGGIYIWGAQLEDSTYATSYIPTTSAAVTRNADVISKTGISSLIGQTSGSVFFDFTVDTISSQTSDPVLWYMKDGGVGERYVELYSSGNLAYVEYTTLTISNIVKTGLTVGRHKCAIAYAANDFVFYVDGVQVGTDTSGTPSGFSTFALQYYNSTYLGQQYVNSVALFPTRLTNAELASLTT